MRQVRRPTGAPSLSAREIEVLRLVGKGLSNAEIGRELFISESTVKTHLLRVFAKLEVADRTAAVTTAMGPAPAVTPTPVSPPCLAKCRAAYQKQVSPCSPGRKFGAQIIE